MPKYILFLAKLLGAKYILNHRSGEIHRIKHLRRSCWVHLMTDYTIFWRRSTINYLQKNDPDINGCIHCFKNLNTD